MEHKLLKPGNKCIISGTDGKARAMEIGYELVIVSVSDRGTHISVALEHPDTGPGYTAHVDEFRTLGIYGNDSDIPMYFLSVISRKKPLNYKLLHLLNKAYRENTKHWLGKPGGFTSKKAWKHWSRRTAWHELEIHRESLQDNYGEHVDFSYAEVLNEVREYMSYWD